ncbi:hypothetical protein QFC22_003615 [Naganishia vaughanmartiniae]|uniref:Uncharacterized protein n=1 Tax=Naganishia vaughanmartiniae TaxID=1424756 RepID=A0ACC2X525_9TREE|nr:hypothetical protein QFC22_003615 [Naganishia vaughanmartiniae]
METRRGRRSVIDLTASGSPPDGPRPLIATASIAPRRRLRDGSHSSRSSTATLSDVIGNIAHASGSGSGSGAVASGRQRPGVEQGNSRGRGSTSSESQSVPSGRTSETVPRPQKRARLTSHSGGEQRINSSAAAREASDTTRMMIASRTFAARPNHQRARAPTVNDFEADSSDETPVRETNLASAETVIVPETDEDDTDTDDDDNKTDTMTVNADTSDNEFQEYEVLEDSDVETPGAPLRDAVRRPATTEDTEADELAGDGDSDDMDGFEIVSPVRTTTTLKDANAARDRFGHDHASGVGKGKGRAIVEDAPGEPLENLLASFGELMILCGRFMSFANYSRSTILKECPICFMPPSQAVLTPCGHIMCGKCLFDTLKSQAIRDGKRPNPVGQYPPTRSQNGRRKTKKEIELEKSRPSLKGRLLTGSCPVCRKELEGGFGTVAGEGGVKSLEIRTLTEL